MTVRSGDAVIPVAMAGEGSRYVDGLALSLGEGGATGYGPTGNAIRYGCSFVTNDYHADVVMAPWHERAKAYGFKSSAAFPSVEGGRPAKWPIRLAAWSDC